jgi:hypothetical protein
VELRKYKKMAFFEDRVLTGIVDDDSYRAWHQKDHVRLRWLEGKPWAEGSVMYAEEYLHGKLHKLKLRHIIEK